MTSPTLSSTSPRPEIVVEDDRTGMSPESLERAVLDHLRFTRSKVLETATSLDVYFALAYTVRDRLMERWMATKRAYQDQNPKRVYYLSAEFLMGRFMHSNLLNLGLYDFAAEQLRRYDLELSEVLEHETDPGLGNGGLGRLAACFLDSMATLGLPGYGYGIRYEFGIFRQELSDGCQVEQPDAWLRHGNPWEIRRPEHSVEVRFGGRVEQTHADDGNLRWQWVDGQRIVGVPYDYPVAGYGTPHVNTLRLWRARASEDFDLAVFNDGDYRRAVEQKALSESISKVLYPKDESPAGKELRLKQQYFFVACSIHDILRRYFHGHPRLDALAGKVAIQLNDTHPAIAVAEMMRVLLDDHHLEWEEAWSITQGTLAYTNHTLLPEALERWPVDLFARLLPRHLQIIFEINHRFLRQVHVFAPGDDARKRRMSLIEEGPTQQIRMAHLAVVGCHSVNGVAELHSELVKRDVLRDFAEMFPERFNNKTNGVTPRRWLMQCNPRLSALIDERIGRAWVTDLSQLSRLRPLAEDPSFCEAVMQVKRANKRVVADTVRRRFGLHVDPDRMLFDVQVKRIHEYKRQLMNCLHLVAQYRRLKFAHPDDDVFVPRFVVFGGKAAPGYAQAKKQIKLINDVATIINQDPQCQGKLAALFWPNYNVSQAEHLIPATDLSEQISMAGKEASGTGNMKFQMNGALTIGTLDGANIEIREEVGADNFFLFGLHADAVRGQKAAGYDPNRFIDETEELRAAVELIEEGFFSPEHRDLHREVVDYLRLRDPYLICADYADYARAQREVDDAYRDASRWGRMVVHNIASSGKFSSDRTIAQYARDIWDVTPVPVESLVEPMPPRREGS
ncbi:MAG: glycogen/starch/alpha-glucan phosphorylase [Myxococcota bacterium]